MRPGVECRTSTLPANLEMSEPGGSGAGLDREATPVVVQRRLRDANRAPADSVPLALEPTEGHEVVDGLVRDAQSFGDLLDREQHGHDLQRCGFRAPSQTHR